LRSKRLERLVRPDANFFFPDRLRIEFDAELVREENEVEADAEGEGDVPEGFVRGRNPKEAKMYARLRKGIQRSLSTTEHGQVVEEEEEGKTEADGEGERHIQRTHPLTQLGWFGTFPGTTVTPASIARPTAALLSTANNKHLDDAIFRILVPTLEKTPVRTKHSDNAYDDIPLGTSHGMGEMEANVYMDTILPGLGFSGPFWCCSVGQPNPSITAVSVVLCLVSVCRPKTV
jgi:hypothetical protein